jgi:hypothetical protein
VANTASGKYRINKRLSSPSRKISVFELINETINNIVGTPIAPLSIMVSNANEVVFLGPQGWAEEGDQISLEPKFGQYTIRVYKKGVQIAVAPIEEIWSIKDAKKVFAGWTKERTIEAVNISIVWL